MKKGLILTGLLIVAAVFYTSCDNDQNMTAPSIIEGNSGDTQVVEISANASDKAMYVFALDQNLEQVSKKVFEDLGELELVLSEEILEEMKEERVSVIEEANDVDEVRETIFAELHVSEYMSIKSIGNLYIEKGTVYEGCSWSCIKSCMNKEDYNACMVRCCSSKDTGLVPYKDW